MAATLCSRKAANVHNLSRPEVESLKSDPEMGQATSFDPDSEITPHVIPSGPVQNLFCQKKKAAQRAGDGFICNNMLYIAATVHQVL